MVIVMAKKKPQKPRAARMVLGIRGSDAWKAWLDTLAESERATVSDLIDWALEEFAAKRGHKPPPKR